MARILICHVPKDGGLARDLGALLMGRGHFVSFDGEPDVPKEDRGARLRQFEAVVVMWTETSAQSGGLADIASETMPLNILVPVRSESLAASDLPLKFRKLNMFGPRDVDGISRLVARLSHAQSSLKEMTAREAQREASFAVEPPYQRPIPPQATLRPTPPPAPEKPQKPALPVFVKQRIPAAPPAPEPSPQPAAAPAPHIERPSFPPKIAKTAELPEPPAAAAPPLPPFVTRRLSPNGTAAPAATPAPPQRQQSPAPRAATPANPRTAEPKVSKSPGHEAAWRALADELGEPANPVVAPVSSRPHAPYGRPPIATQPPPAVETQAYDDPAQPAVPEPPSPVKRSASPITPPSMAPPVISPPSEPPRRAVATPSYASLRPQAAPPPTHPAGPPPLKGAPPPVPSRDGLGAGSPSFSAVAMAQHLARLVEGGLLLIYIPEATWLGEPITTEVRLGRELLDEAQGDPRSAHDRITIDTISVSLISDDPGFSIERQSERTQFVGQRFQDHAGAHGRWAWLVTPHTPGDYDLIVRISALVRDRSGVPTPVALPDRRYSIAVHAREARAR